MKRKWIVIALTAALGLLAAEDTPPKTPEQIEAELRIQQLKAEKDLLEAQTAKFKAEQDAEAARKKYELDKLTAEKAMLDAQNSKSKAETDAAKDKRQADIDKLKAEKELIAAATAPVSGTKSGTVTYTGDATPMESTVMAYRALAEAAGAIATKVICKDGPVLIHSAADVAAIHTLGAFEAQIQILEQRLTSIINTNNDPNLKEPKPIGPSAALEALGLVGPAITAVTNLISLFKVDDTFVPKDEVVDSGALVGLVANALAPACQTVYYSESMPPRLLAPTTGIASKVMSITNLLDKLHGIVLQRTADKTVADTHMDETKKKIDRNSTVIALRKAILDLNAKLKELKDPKGKDKDAAEKLQKALKEKEDSMPSDAEDYSEDTLKGFKSRLVLLTAWRANLDKYLAVLEPTVKGGDDLMATLVRADQIGSSAMILLIRAERLRDLLSERRKNTYSLQLSVQKFGGTRWQHSNFLGTSVAFSGGTVASFIEYRLWTCPGPPSESNPGSPSPSGVPAISPPAPSPASSATLPTDCSADGAIVASGTYTRRTKFEKSAKTEFGNNAIVSQ